MVDGQAAPAHTDLINLFHLLQASAGIIRRLPDGCIDVVLSNNDVADYLAEIAHDLNERWEVLP